MTGDVFRVDCVIPLFYKFKPVNLNCEGTYPDSREWLKNKKLTKNSQNKKVVCFKYTVTDELNHRKIKKRSAKNIIG